MAPATLRRTLGAICGCAAGVALVVAGWAPLWVGLAVALAWTLAAWMTVGVVGLTAALPACALLSTLGVWWALAAWTLAAWVCAWGLDAWLAAARRAHMKSARRRLRALEFSRDSLERHLNRYPVLLDICLELSSARGVDQVGSTLMHGARALLPDARCIRMYLSDVRGQRLLAQDGSGPDPEPRDLDYVASEQRQLVRREAGTCRALFPLRSERYGSDRHGADGRNPATARKGYAGVLCFDIATDHLEDLDLDALAAAARLGGLGLSSVALVDQARAMALTDDLTGVYGRMEFLRRLDEHVASARRQETPLSVIACDMDHLKRYNDAYGHLAGDAALLAVARCCLSAAPAEAIISRSGGEEFALLLPGYDRERAAACAETLRALVADSRPDPEHPERRISISLGVATMSGREAPQALLDRADAACYRAKAAGRNRVEVAA